MSEATAYPVQPAMTPGPRPESPLRNPVARAFSNCCELLTTCFAGATMLCCAPCAMCCMRICGDREEPCGEWCVNWLGMTGLLCCGPCVYVWGWARDSCDRCRQEEEEEEEVQGAKEAGNGAGGAKADAELPRPEPRYGPEGSPETR